MDLEVNRLEGKGELENQCWEALSSLDYEKLSRGCTFAKGSQLVLPGSLTSLGLVHALNLSLDYTSRLRSLLMQGLFLTSVCVVTSV